MSNFETGDETSFIRRSKSGKATRVFHEDGTDTIFVNNGSEDIYNQILALGRENGVDVADCDFDSEFDELGDFGDFESPLTKIVDAVLQEPDVHPSLRYAWEITGRVVTEENRTLLTPSELAEWYCVLHDWEINYAKRDELFEEDPNVTEAVEKTLAYYRTLRSSVAPESPSGYILIDLLHIATLLVAGRIPAASDLLSRLVYQTSIEQIDVFIRIGGTLMRDCIESGAVHESEEIVDATIAIGEIFNVETEAIALINSIELAEGSFNISGDYFTMTATVVCCVAALLLCDLVDDNDIHDFLNPSL